MSLVCTDPISNRNQSRHEPGLCVAWRPIRQWSKFLDEFRRQSDTFRPPRFADLHSFPFDPSVVGTDDRRPAVELGSAQQLLHSELTDSCVVRLPLTPTLLQCLIPQGMLHQPRFAL